MHKFTLRTNGHHLLVTFGMIRIHIFITIKSQTNVIGKHLRIVRGIQILLLKMTFFPFGFISEISASTTLVRDMIDVWHTCCGDIEGSVKGQLKERRCGIEQFL